MPRLNFGLGPVERRYLPLFLGARSELLLLMFRLTNLGWQEKEKEVWTHTNDTLGSLRRQILHLTKVDPSNLKLKLELAVGGGDLLNLLDDCKVLG